MKSKYTKNKYWKCIFQESIIKLMRQPQKSNYMYYIKYRKETQEEGMRKSMTFAYIFFLLINQQFNGLQIFRFIIGAFNQQVYNYFNMKSIILILTLAYLVTSDSFVIIRSEVGDLITYPAPPHLAVQNTYPYNLNIGGSGAVWIWDKNWNNYKIRSHITVTKNFYTSCLNTMTVYATADDKFTIHINGNPILTGNNCLNLYNATFIPKCGVNTFTMTAENKRDIAGLIYAIIQDTSTCYNCKPGQTWNPKTCSCKCADHCPCRKNQIWNRFPECECSCSTKIPCDQKHYWDENSCSCKCIPKSCRPGYIQNMNTCQCFRRFHKFANNFQADVVVDGGDEVDTWNIWDPADVAVEDNDV